MIWKNCGGPSQVSPLEAKAYRVIEDQSSSYTRKLVDSKEEHDVLESLIENVKPPVPKGKEFDGLHYLLSTPFRYPPLEYGSRFGGRFERSIWYGSLSLMTAFSEVAYYRFLFLSQSEAKLDYIKVQQTSYSVNVKSKRAINLTQTPFLKYKTQLLHPRDYSKTQQLGSDMRKNDVECFLSFSARDKSEGVNVGVFTPKAFLSKSPNEDSFQHWHGFVFQTHVEFVDIRKEKSENYIFMRDELA